MKLTIVITLALSVFCAATLFADNVRIVSSMEAEPVARTVAIAPIPTPTPLQTDAARACERFVLQEYERVLGVIIIDPHIWRATQVANSDLWVVGVVQTNLSGSVWICSLQLLPASLSQPPTWRLYAPIERA